MKHLNVSVTVGMGEGILDTALSAGVRHFNGSVTVRVGVGGGCILDGTLSAL